MQFHEPKKKKVLINITSLIDVLFLLLIFFMVSSTFREQPGMKLELPESKSHEITEIKELILKISQQDDGTPVFILNTERILFDSLGSTLKSMLTQTTDKALTLKADKNLTHGLVVKIMDIARQSGVKKLVVATKVAKD